MVFNSEKILVIGGYGAVGEVISTSLAKRYPGQVTAAGRNIQKTEALSVKTNGAVLPLAVDIHDPELNYDQILAGVSQVILCIDQTDTTFVEQVIQRGIDYIDITASSSYLEMVESLSTKASQSNSTITLSVGLAPGLTNLLAAQSAAVLDHVDHVDIFVMLGMGDAHGDAAIQWTLDNLDSSFTIREDGQNITVNTFDDGLPVELPGIGKRTAYRFDFPSQHSLPKTAGIDSISTRLCFDVESMNRVLGAFRRLGMLQMLTKGWIRDSIHWIMKNIHVGSDQFMIKVAARGDKNGAQTGVRSTVRGANEARMTGLVAAQVARQLYSGTSPAGVFHIDQLFDLHAVIGGLVGAGLLEYAQEIG